MSEESDALLHIADDHPCCKPTLLWAQNRLLELERESAELRAALTLGQENCNEEYDRLRKERDANKTALAATRSQLVALREDNARLEYLLRELSGPRPFWQWHNWTREQMIVAIDAARKEAQP